MFHLAPFELSGSRSIAPPFVKYSAQEITKSNLLADVPLCTLVRVPSVGKFAMSEIARTNAKISAREAIDLLPDEATWEDVMYRIYVRQKIEAGLRDVEAGRTLTTAEVRSRFGLEK